MKNKKTGPDRHEELINNITAMLEQGVRPWFAPWASEHPAGPISRPLRWNGQPYRGINVVSLWMASTSAGLATPFWMSFKQAVELGGCVRKGERGSTVFYASTFEKEETGADGEATTRNIPFLKASVAFNASQVDGLPQQYYAKPKAMNPDNRIEDADVFILNTGAVIEPGPQPCYIPALDVIKMPPFETFLSAGGHASTMFHELSHWSGHKDRLAREFGKASAKNTRYAKEELIAELSCAFLCADLGVAPEELPQHAAYLGHWIAAMKEDSRFLFSVASAAEKATTYLHSLQPVTAPPDMS